jgi:hypothetical protein
MFIHKDPLMGNFVKIPLRIISVYDTISQHLCIVLKIKDQFEKEKKR